MTETLLLRPDEMKVLGVLRCPDCGLETDVRCGCGKPYEYVRASEAAAKAIEANPTKSDRAIAEEVGVDHKTVGKARQTTGEKSPVEKRVGLDGKARRSPERKQKGSIPVEQEYFDRIERATALATVPYTGGKVDEAIKLARGVATAWNELADKLEKQCKALN